MGLVHDRIAKFEAKAPAMSQELQEFLDIVWTHRKAQATKTGPASYAAANADVYGLYARSSTHPGGLHLTRPFLKGILGLPQLPEIQCTLGGDDALGTMLKDLFGATEAPSGFARLDPADFADLIEEAEHSDALAWQLASTFYHFRRALAFSSDRIYLRIQPHQALNVIRFVLQELVMNRVNHPGVSNAKVGAPGGLERADGIVIYLGDAQASDRALAAIAAYQRDATNRARFAPGHTRGTKPIDRHGSAELVGVSVGAEPPVALAANPSNPGQLVLVEGASSFGSFRASLIQLALTKTMGAGQDKAAFVQRTLAYFRAAGIDPRQPHQHTMARELRARARETLRQIRAGREPTFKIG